MAAIAIDARLDRRHDEPGAELVVRLHDALEHPPVGLLHEARRTTGAVHVGAGTFEREVTGLQQVGPMTSIGRRATGTQNEAKLAGHVGSQLLGSISVGIRQDQSPAIRVQLERIDSDAGAKDDHRNVGVLAVLLVELGQEHGVEPLLHEQGQITAVAGHLGHVSSRL